MLRHVLRSDTPRRVSMTALRAPRGDRHRLADPAPAAKLAVFGDNDKTAGKRDEHALCTTTVDIAKTTAAQRFPRMRLLSADARAGQSGAAEFSRRRPRCARSWRCR